MIRSLVREGAFPLALFAFAAVGISYVSVPFNLTTRWVLLIGLAAILLIRGQFFSFLRSEVSVTLIPYQLWCLATVLWSEVPQLSLLKAAALILTAWAFLAGGMTWSRSQPYTNRLLYLLPIVVLALVSGIFKRPADIGEDYGEIVLYEGLAGNPNYLGTLVAMTLPFGLYYGVAARNVSAPWLRGLGTILLVATPVLLWFSGSRASLLIALAIGASYAIVVPNVGKVLTLSVLAITIGLSAMVVAPEIQNGVYDRFIIKGDAGGDIFGSRRDNWAESYDAAAKGGAIGVGYAVSAGDKQFVGGLTSINYGREKGSTQLAVWEETGLIGLMLYGALIIQIGLLLARAVGSAKDRHTRIQAALVAGAALGLLAQSVFEAWWSAPGSLESAFFWASLGVALGMPQRSDSAARTRAALQSMYRFRSQTSPARPQT